MLNRVPDALLIERARVFATAAHAGQVRKYTGEPYVNHCAEVAALVAEHGGSSAQVAAAWLHDTVEGTPVTIELIRIEFGEVVAALVAGLTDVSTPADGNRAARKAKDRAHTREQSQACKYVKLADLISNTRSIAAHDPDFARVYLAEKHQLLVEGGFSASTLMDEASSTLFQSLDALA
ncbi:hypothetical protein BJP27_24465 (plasmid) [Pseudomonas oryzihabitans]|nr:hypothetical protein BJP27_24465 [Pseudomonas psychrotolerans]